MESYYFHHFRNYNIETLIQVLNSGFILPRCMMSNPPVDKNNIFNGDQWISLTQKTLMDEGMCYYFRSAYNELVPGNVCVVISSDIEGVVFTNYVRCEWAFSQEEKERIFFNDGKERFSYYLDEVQTNIPIPVSKFIAIGYPISHFKESKSDREIILDIKTIESAILKSGIDIPILDSTSYCFADDSKQMELSKRKILEVKDKLGNSI